MCSYSKAGFHHRRCISVCAMPSWKKNWLCYWVIKVIFWVQLHVISVHVSVQMVEAQTDPTQLLSVSFTLAILPIKHWLPHKCTSPGHEARKAKPEFLESSHQHINDLCSHQRTNPLSETGDLIWEQTWRTKNSHLFLSFVIYRLTFGSREMQHTGGSSCTCKISSHHLQQKISLP